MFEKILERILKKYLAPYIDGISRDGLSILKGDLSLSCLEVKAEAFDFLKPYGVLLKSGKIDRLHIQIPWRQLTQGKITIELESIAVAVARIQGNIPDDGTILWDNWQSKIAKVEKKAQELQELAESSGEDSSGYLGRWMHRLAQNIQVAVGGGVMLQGFDTKQALSGGVLLDGLRVTSVGEAIPDPQVVALQKRIEITNVAAYVTVDDGAPRYMLEPTRLILSVDHRASSLDAKLELLDRSGRRRGAAAGCRLAVSRPALVRLATTCREMGAWQAHCQEVISRHCQHVATDEGSLTGETYREYTQLYRRRQLGGERALSREEEDALQAIEEAVMSRHLARWRLEVDAALKKSQQTSRSWRLLGGGRNGLVKSDEWEQLREGIRDAQAHLADLGRPQTVTASIVLRHICLLLYDDAVGRFQSMEECAPEDQLGYTQLVAELDRFDVGAATQHDLRLELSQPQTSAKITPRVVGGYERSEWCFGVCFGTMEVWSGKQNVLRYISPDAMQMAGQLEPHQFKDVAIWSCIRDDGTELVSASICLPPIQLCTSPEALAVALALVSLELPEAPDYGKKAKPESEMKAEEEANDWYNMHGTYWSEWEDNFSQWKREVVFEAAEKQAERAKESALVFQLDLAVSAPQLTLEVGEHRRIHVDLGRLHLKSDGVMKADDFKATLELSDTQVTCVAGLDPDGEELRLPVLEPISLAVAVAGKGQPNLGSKALDLSLDVQLRRFKFGIYPRAVHLILEAPKAYLAVLDVKQEALQHRVSAGRRSVRGSADFSSSAGQGQQEGKSKEAASGEAAATPYTVRATAAIQLISLCLYNLELDPVTRIDVADLRAEGSSLPTKAMSGGASMKYFLIEALGKPLLHLRDSQGAQGQDAGEALRVQFDMQADQPMNVALSLCPVQVEWRKENVRALIAAAASCAQPQQPGIGQERRDSELAEATLNQLSSAIEARARERRGSMAGRRSLGPRKTTVMLGDDASREVARRGLTAGGELPALKAEREAARPTVVADLKFGGLLIKLYREEHERLSVIPAWRARSGWPLLEWHAIDLTAKYEAFAGQEARCRIALDSFSVLYDGHCIISPFHSGSSLFESSLRLYPPAEEGGPLHSVCFQGMLRKISIVFFHKHMDSLTDYLSSNVGEALAQKTAGDVKEAMEKPKTAESVALWNVFIESPVIYLARDEEMLRYSPMWQDEDHLAPVAGEPHVEAEDTEFEDASEHPTPMVEELQQYVIMQPGSIQARNTFQADGSESPPMLLAVSFSQTNMDAVDRVGPRSGNMLKIDNWDLLVRLDSATCEQPMHVSVGLEFKPISCFLTPERLELVLDCLQENISYKNYFPQPPVQAPDDRQATGGPSFCEGADLVQSMVVNVRIQFEGLNVTLSRIPLGVSDSSPQAYEPLLSLAIGTMRLLVDSVFYYGGAPMALQFGVFLDAVLADDLRPPEARAQVLSTRLLELQSEGGFSSEEGTDDWTLLPDREQGRRPYRPRRAALLLLFAIASASSSSLRFELRRPRIFALLRLATETAEALMGGFSASSMVVYPGPPGPLPLDMPAAPPAPTDQNLAVSLSVQEASLSMYTSCARAAAPVLQATVSLSTELGLSAASVKIKDVSLSDLRVSRTEAADMEQGGSFRAASGGKAPSVKLFTLSSLQVTGELVQGPRKELDVKVRAEPAAVRLTTGDVPHLVAALTGLGGDGRREEAPEDPGGASAGAATEPAGAELAQGRVGVLRLLLRGLPGAPSLDALQVTARFGDQHAPVTVPWGRPLLLSVPPVRGLGSHLRVAEGPVLRLALQGLGGEGLATMDVPVELCAGRGLDGTRLLRSVGTRSEEAKRALGEEQGRTLLELDMQVHYEPSAGAGAVALGVAALSGAVESVEDFVKPCEQLEDFLGASVPRLAADLPVFARRSSRCSIVRDALQKRKSFRRAPSMRHRTSGAAVPATSAAPAPASAPPLAIRAVVSLESFEASFLDDCQAHVLPVLRFRLRAGAEGAGGRPGPVAAQVASERASMIKFEMNPWGSRGQRKGLSLGVENYYIGVNYLNARAGCWEPFLEPWAVDFFYSAYADLEHGHAGLTSKASGSPLLNARYDAATEITLMSFGPLNVNVTPQLCGLASFLLSNKEAYVKRLEAPGTAVEGAGGARYRLLNLSGVPVCLAVIQPGSSGQESGGGQGTLDWRVFEPCVEEAPLDPLLGHRSAEEWRVLADETLSCLVGLLPPGGPVGAGGAPREPLRVLLSSTCDGLVPVPEGPAAHAACEVLLPHPSHHLMLISGRLRVFNHTSQALEVRFGGPGSSASSSAPPGAAPMHVLPERLARPPEIAAALQLGAEGEAPFGAQKLTWEPSQHGSWEQTGPVKGEPEAQRLPPQHFCSAPLWAAGPEASLQLRLAGATSWSDAVTLGVGGSTEDTSGKPVLVPGAGGALLRLHSYRSQGGPRGAGGCAALHVCAPLRLVNATPVRLSFSFLLEGPSQQPMTVEVDAFSDCDVSSELDPSQPFSLSLALADDHVDAKAPGDSEVPSGNWAESPMVQRIFDVSQPPEELVPVPLTRGGGASGPSLGVTVSRGLAVRASCSRWLVDRTGLGLRALCMGPGEVPGPCAAPLPQVDGHITLLDHVQPQAPKRGTRKGQPEQKYYLAAPDGNGMDGWSALAAAKLPDEDHGFVHATLASTNNTIQHTSSGSIAGAGYSLHVCLESEAVSRQLTFGAPCQVISVLPQVVIYNQLSDDVLLVRALGDAGTEVSVPAKQSRGFLRWQGEGNAASGKSPLSVQFRPAKLADTCGWSTPIGFGVGEASGPMALLLPPSDPAHSRPSSLRPKSSAPEMFTAEVAERGGVVCLTVSRGSRRELQNFSCLVETVTLRPRQQQGGPVDSEEFSARSCETVEFAWPCAATESQLEVVLAWSRAAGGASSRGPAPDVRKPGRVVFPAPDGWQAVLVETGSTGDVCWFRVQDVVWTTMQESERAKGPQAKGPSPAQLKVVVSIAHVGLSLVSPKREQELLYAEVRNVAALLGRWESCVCLETCVSNMQVDCQLLDYKDCPVVFANRGEPALQCKVIQQLPGSNAGVGLESLGVSISPLELSVNEGFLAEVGEAVSDMLKPILRLEELGREQIEAWRNQPLGGVFQVPPPVPSQIDISQFTFLGLEVHLWASMRLAKLPAALRGALGVLTVGSDRLSIQGATLQLDPEVFDNIHGPAPTVAKIIMQRYWANLLLSLASLLGRSTLLELPSLPVKWGRRGVESGMCAINFLLTRTANVFEFCTLDKQYVRQKRPLLGQQIMEVTSLKTGVGAAGQHLAEGVMHVGDIVREPIEGAREAGAKGFALGVGRGVMGTVVRPVLGAVYGARSLARGVRIAAGRDGEGACQRHVASRRRPPRVMYAAGAIREYVETQPAGLEQ